ncbi:MAG: ATP-dependent sacrificial sulfur transferase LarE [Candidatus Hodarchaeales archaeon]
MKAILNLSKQLDDKLKQLEKYFQQKTVLVAYSGGVDSAVIAEIAHRNATKMIAVTADSPTVLPGEITAATDLAQERGWEHMVITLDELKDENFVANPHDRCYYCKKGLAKALEVIALEEHADIIVEGTNMSEVKGHRPGLQALTEQLIDSPLYLNKLEKAEVRQLAKHLGLSNAEKPSLACLSSRFPTGVRITREKLKRVGLAERFLLDTYQLKTLRVRDHEGLARIEVGFNEREKLLSSDILDEIQVKLKDLGFKYVSIDCAGYRTGSLTNEGQVRPH